MDESLPIPIGNALSRNKHEIGTAVASGSGGSFHGRLEAGMPKRAPMDGFTAFLGRNYPAHGNSTS